MNERQRRIFAIVLAVALIAGILATLAAPLLAR